MSAAKNNQGAQTELVKSWIISYIREHHLQIGDKLPSQVQMRSKLGVGCLTIHRALQTLAAAGIVEPKKNSGVYLKNTDLAGYCGRKIGLVSLRLPGSVCANLFLQNLQFALHDRGAQCLNILRDNSPLRQEDVMPMFSGLERFIRQREVDGLILTVPMEKKFFRLCEENGIPWCYYGDHQNIANCVRSVDYRPDVIRKLTAAGCRRPAVLLSSQTNREFLPQQLLDDLSEIWQGGCGEGIWSLERNNFSSLNVRNYLHGAAGAAAKFAGMPAAERPDGFFIPDDFLTAAFCQHLADAGIPQPKIIAQSNKQIPIYLPPAVIGYYENDEEKLANAVADMMFQLLDSPRKKYPEPVFCHAEYHSNTEDARG